MNYQTYMKSMNFRLLEGSEPCGKWEIPRIRKTNFVPEKLVSFSKMNKEQDMNCWVHFFMHDVEFNRIFRRPEFYLQKFQNFDGLISLDCSVFWDMPLFTQIESIIASRVMASWWQYKGLNVIANIRWGKPNTYNFAFDGIEQGGTVCVSNAGCSVNREEIAVFEQGLKEMVKRIKPSTIIVYGSIKRTIYSKIDASGIRIVNFPSEASKVQYKEKVLSVSN